MEEFLKMGVSYGCSMLIAVLVIIQSYRISEDFRTKYMERYFTDQHIMQKNYTQQGADFQVVKKDLGEVKEKVTAIHSMVVRA